MTVVATDGFPVHPMTFDTLISMSGERYDVIIHALDRSISIVLYNISSVCLFTQITLPFSAESYVRLRAFGSCEKNEVQTFGRIIYVDDQFNYQKSLSDARPYTDRPDYHQPFKLDAIVMFRIILILIRFFFTF